MKNRCLYSTSFFVRFCSSKICFTSKPRTSKINKNLLVFFNILAYSVCYKLSSHLIKMWSHFCFKMQQNLIKNRGTKSIAFKAGAGTGFFPIFGRFRTHADTHTLTRAHTKIVKYRGRLFEKFV